MSARAVTFLKYSLLLTPLALLPIVSCNGGGGGGGGGTSAFANALIACGLLTPGQFGPANAMVEPFDNCLGQCLAGGTCAELEQFFCTFGPEGDALFETCYAQCIAAHGHGCDGTTLPPYAKCDGFEDCSDGSDELGCPPPFMCGDGETLPPDWQCDGEPDCADGSDELNCPAPSTFTCGDGQQIPADYQCDLEADCADASDEAGCAMLNCPDNGMETFSTFTTSPATDTTGVDTVGTSTG